MNQLQKLLLSMLSGCGDQNICFTGLLKLLAYFEFNVRIKGSHHICSSGDVVEIINLLPVNGIAKPDQVMQAEGIGCEVQTSYQGSWR